jgi:hypothetical protein
MLVQSILWFIGAGIQREYALGATSVNMWIEVYASQHMWKLWTEWQFSSTDHDTQQDIGAWNKLAESGIILYSQTPTNFQKHGQLDWPLFLVLWNMNITFTDFLPYHYTEHNLIQPIHFQSHMVFLGLLKRIFWCKVDKLCWNSTYRLCKCLSS